MRHQFFWWLNGIIVATIGIFLFLALYKHISRTDSFTQPPISERSSVPPQSSFNLKESSYQEIGQRGLSLQFKTPQLGVPDLRNILTFYGRNMRPDAVGSTLFFSLSTPPEIVSVSANQPVYLVRSTQSGKLWNFSPRNQPTDIWFQASPKGNQAAIQVQTREEDGTIVSQPQERAAFLLTEKPIPASSQSWNLGKWRVDGTLFVRLKARWNGRDLFLEKHGGDEFQHLNGKQRIVFGDAPESYSMYVGPQDLLIWKDNQWQQISPGEATQNFPLLKIEKIDERIMNAVLFDPTGKSKQMINIIKIPDPFTSQEIDQQFQFSGSRTRVHSMFNINGHRELVGPGDWFLHTENEWKKLTSGKDVDSYVQGGLKGELLVIDQLAKDNENRWLNATLFNKSRSDTLPVILPLKPKEYSESANQEEREEASPEAAPPAAAGAKKDKSVE